MKSAGYALMVIGVLGVIAGVVMMVAMHFHGKAYAALGVGAVLLIAGIVATYVIRPGKTVA
ncbi:MAG TPA: hypothetical protein VFN23_05395 [Ktedonobacteraceae bacterium]|nr:hypothetical protein [Ktedonobacteraceae bacterium]